MTLKSEVAELRYEVAELSSGELRLTFTTATTVPQYGGAEFWRFLNLKEAIL